MAWTKAKKRKAQHPRSLDALFPRPKVRRCARGHSQTPEWRPTRGCLTCRRIDQERENALLFAADGARRAAVAEREHWRQVLPKLPAVIEWRTVHEGKLIRFTIPPHVQRKAASRRPRRRI